MTRAALLVTATLSIGQARPEGGNTPTADKAVGEAIKVLEGSLAGAKADADKAKIQAAITALRAVTTPAVRNDSLSDFIDNPAKYRGQRLTYRARYHEKATEGLRDRVGDGGNTPFEAVDSRNRAKVVIGLKIPAGFKVPAANPGEELIITFTCNGTNTNNDPIEIRRP